MNSGIYCYRDKFKDTKIVYVGKDSHIDKNTRHKQHINPAMYDKQVINRVLQNNPQRYQYEVLKQSDFEEGLLSALEIIYIKRYNPKFNYTIGGEGVTGYKHSSKTKKRISESVKGKNNPFYGKHHSLKTREKISEMNKGRKHSDETCRKMSESHKGVPLSKEHKQRISESHKGKKRLPFSDEWKKKISDATKGENNPNYRIDIPNGEELYFENKFGSSQLQLSKKYGCCAETIRLRIKKYKEEMGLV